MLAYNMLHKLDITMKYKTIIWVDASNSVKYRVAYSQKKLLVVTQKRLNRGPFCLCTFGFFILHVYSCAFQYFSIIYFAHILIFKHLF